MSNWLMRYGFTRHPLSALFGDMHEKALLDMAADIKIHGVLEAVVLYEGQVLDGWCRCQAWLKIIRAWRSERDQLALYRHRERLSKYPKNVTVFPSGEEDL